MAAEMLYLRDFETDPCENFYKHACSDKELSKTDYFEEMYTQLLNWIKRNHNEIAYIKNFKSFHDKCVSYSYDFSLKDRLTKSKYRPTRG